MLRIFPVLFVCATLAVGGCASTGGSAQNNANAVESEGDDGAVERTTSKGEARSSRAETKREARERRREAKREKAAAKSSEKAAAKSNIQTVDVEKNFRGEIHGTPAKGSKFTKLRIGMSQNQVLDMIGPGTDSKGYITGKNFVPFYYGPDRYRIETFYKGSGRLVFTSQHRLITIIHDSTEDGYQ